MNEMRVKPNMAILPSPSAYGIIAILAMTFMAHDTVPADR